MSVRHLLRGQALILLGLVIVAEVWAAAVDEAVEARMRKDITFLASDECEGRGPGTKGIDLAADYIANEFKNAGLKSGAGTDNYFQPFTMSGSPKLGAPNSLRFNGPQGQEIELAIDKDYRPLGLTAAAKLTAPLVFVGYGATAEKISYDDYKDLDVAGKIVVLLRKTPRADNTLAPFDDDRSIQHAALRQKLINAGEHKAALVIFVNDRDTAKSGDPLMELEFSGFAAANPSKVPAVQIRRDVLDRMLRSILGVGLREMEQDIDHDLKPRSAPLTGWTASAEVNVSRPTINVKNVVGVLEGNGPLAKQIIVVGAHYDHLGYGGMNSLAKGNKSIHHGADDNASGTTTLIELARRFGQDPNRQGRRLVFIAFSGEESGLLGSAYYCKNPLFPLADTAAMVNLDMVGRLRPDKEANKDKLIVYGTGTAKTFDSLIESLNKKHDFKLQKVPGGFGPSDHASFYAQKIPVFFFFTGEHSDYHKPSDTADRINVAGMRRVASLVEEVAGNLAAVSERPEYVKVASKSSGVSSFKGPKLGIMPGNYGEEKDDGVLVGSVSEGGPAAKGGIKEGDRIIELGGKAVKNLSDYMAQMNVQKKGQPLDVGIIRGGKKMTVKVTLE